MFYIYIYIYPSLHYRKLFSCACYCFESKDGVLFCLLLVSFYWCLSVSLPEFVTLTGLP